MASRNIAGGRAWFGKWIQICATLEGCCAGIEMPVDFMNAVVRFKFCCFVLFQQMEMADCPDRGGR